MPITFENLLLSCLQLGLTLDDFKKLKVGTILDLITTKSNNVYDSEIKYKENKQNNKDEVRMATSTDSIMSFF